MVSDRARKAPVPDAEMKAFMDDLELSLKEAASGAVGRVTTGEAIAKRARGRPVLAVHRQPITLRLDPEVLARWRASGKGWQTRAAELLAKQAP